MTTEKSIFGNFGLAAGSLALLMALVHFWAQPLAPQPTLESSVAEKVSSIRTAALDAIKGKQPEKKSVLRNWDIDDVISAVTAALGGIAVVLGVLGFARSERNRVTGGAVMLGASAIAFQFLAWFAMVFLGVVLIIGILASFDIDLSW